jgi:hypothetical protein
VQRRQLHRDAGPVRQGLIAGGAADGIDGGGIGVEVVRRVGGRACALAEHVEGIAVEAAARGACPLQRLLDGLAEDEMTPEDAHGLARRRAHRRQAEPLGELAENPFRRLAWLDDARRHSESPGGSVDQEGVRFRLVVGEVALPQLVLDQAVGGGGVGHAQERLGEHHQGEPLAGGESVFAQHLLNAAEPAAIGADRPDQRPGALVDPALPLGREPRVREQALGDEFVVLRVGRLEAGEGSVRHESLAHRL